MMASTNTQMLKQSTLLRERSSTHMMTGACTDVCARLTGKTSQVSSMKEPAMTLRIEKLVMILPASNHSLWKIQDSE